MQSRGVPDTDETAVAEPSPELERYLPVLDSTLEYARTREYSGPDYGDGMSSQLLQALPVENRFVNLVVQEVVKRAPVDVRPLFRVEHRRNYKGAALFTMANLNYHELARRAATAEGDGTDRGRADVDLESLDLAIDEPAFDPVEEARYLADWLLEERIEGYSGFCGGHRHEIQHLHTKGEPSDPDIVSTTYAVRALLQASHLDDRYAEIARTAADFLVEDLNYREVDEGAKVDYHLNHPDDAYTINAAALGAGMLVDLYDHFGDEEYRERATKVLDHIAANQTDVGGWPYRLPADASHLSMDSHHNGFVIESFQRYRDLVGSDRYADTLSDALEFYRNDLFELDGAPNFDETSAYPRDIHASTQGILVFTREGDLEMAERILRWVLANLQVEDGRFYYRKYRFHTKRVTLMRWCQAWMSYATSEYLLAATDADAATGGPSSPHSL
ncbi:prenyltransferase/squalene oxidase repeat-containing protein [Halopiger goleimassiliensis]|uniref:prenyltransferase/squalene oxidase repeat-containing protein n=1 Tax=Halopiger goleimassiliensis TaxID=1293048 RepID=UPI0006779EEF|nr:prenyltransferase/squalene oxidase repeat-containing protein [Halopiger goleimassiliensis]